jgi:VWFA-related protein
VICLVLAANLLHAQTPEQSTQQPTDVLRVFTDLIQTDVMVFDKQGRLVKGLAKEDFELKIDGKPKPISFFENVTSGSNSEEAQLAAARGESRKSPGSPPVPLDRGRPVFFYVDDLHMELPNVLSTKKLINNFIDKQMGQNDEVAISAASGQVGFLSQLTDNKAVLRAAVERLSFRQYTNRDFERPRMSEYQAMMVTRNDRDILDYFVEPLMALNPLLSRDSAEEEVRSRADRLMNFASKATENTLIGLQSMVRSAQKVPGRKLVFFISDGFLLDSRNSNIRDWLRRITSAASSSGVVIYSIESRGLVAGTSDASTEPHFEMGGRIGRASGELGATQDGLNALAHDTGGKAFFNSNAMSPAVKRTIDETASYYLLAWSPDQATTKPGKFHKIEVRVPSRPELTVQVRRGFFDHEPEAEAKPKKKPKKGGGKPQNEFQKLIAALYPERAVPVSVTASFVNSHDKGDLLLATSVVPSQSLSFAAVEGKATARVTLVGVVYNDNGDVVSQFSKVVTMAAKSEQSEHTGNTNLSYSHSFPLKPGLYQIRVAARDENAGRAGSARSWVVVPNVVAGRFALSSLLLGARTQTQISPVSADSVGFSATDLRFSDRFSQNDFLRFLLFVYNAAQGPNGTKPDVAIQIQVVRDDQPVVTAPLKRLSLDNVDDLKRIPYAAELSLNGLRPGRYVLQISVVDRIAKSSATQQTRFEVQ